MFYCVTECDRYEFMSSVPAQSLEPAVEEETVDAGNVTTNGTDLGNGTDLNNTTVSNLTILESYTHSPVVNIISGTGGLYPYSHYI